ncbi:MAG: DNA-directed RNA polymerase subunit D [Candidatus Syntropharchaeia archaeon]
MDVEIFKLSEREGKFLLSDVGVAFANGIRRCMIAEVPKMAIDEVNIYENTSLLFDEQLALRLALIPLKTDFESYILPSECGCEGGCSSCQVSLTLNVEGPKMVYSGELVSLDPKIHPVERKIPIVKLKKGQRVFLEAIARLGRGKDHAKWQTAVACGYKNLPRVEIEDCNGCGNCIDACPKDLLVLDEIGGKVTCKDEKECSMCRDCEKVCEIGAIRIKSDESSFLFTLESDGSLLVRELVLRAADELEKKAVELKKILEEEHEL